VDEYFS
jgi:predicted ribosome quality control (RQC) complex YloA/Tae2 family protein